MNTRTPTPTHTYTQCNTCCNINNINTHSENPDPFYPIKVWGGNSFSCPLPKIIPSNSTDISASFSPIDGYTHAGPTNVSSGCNASCA